MVRTSSHLRRPRPWLGQSLEVFAGNEDEAPISEIPVFRMRSHQTDNGLDDGKVAVVT